MIQQVCLSPLPGAQVLPFGVQIFGGPGANIGDKAKMLVDHADAISASGFSVPPRVIFSQERLDEILKNSGCRGGISGSSFASLLPTRVKIPEHIQAEIDATLAAIKEKCGDVPVMIRSSGMGDARGTGVYKSRYTQNVPHQARYCFQDVLGGYFSSHASSWRHRTNATQGFAIIIEPMVCQPLPDPKTRRMGPLLSGMGYSSTGIGPTFIKLTYGIGGGAGKRLTHAALVAYDLSAKKFLEQKKDSHILVVSVPYTDDDEEDHGLTSIITGDYAQLLGEVNLGSIFTGMTSLEDHLGKPAYIEWAIAAVGGIQRNYLLQLAAIEPQENRWEFGDVNSVLLKMDDVRRGHDADIDAIVVINNWRQLNGLAEFNRLNSAFLLVYNNANVTGSPTSGRDCPLQMEHISNAALLMRGPGAASTWAWEEHLRGLSETSGIMIGDGMGVNENFLDAVHEHFSYEHGLAVYRRPMRVRYSSSRQEAIVTPR